jgi:nitroreductase
MVQPLKREVPIMDVLDVIKKRRSVRSFKEGVIPRELIEKIVDAGRLAPTARNVQPWEFVVVSDKEKRTKLAALATTGPFIAEAPATIAVFCKDTKYWLEDGCAATENIILAARAFGFGHCWVAGDKKPYGKQVAQLLGVPEGYHLVSLVAIGYMKEEPDAPEKRPLEKVIHWEKF